MSNSSRDYRRRTQRKSMITTVIAGAVIIAAVIAIIVVILSLIRNNSSSGQASATEPSSATVQPTLYIPGEQGGLTPSAVPTQQPGATQPAATQPAATQPGAQPASPTDSVTPTEQPAPPAPVTDAPAQPQPVDTTSDGDSYTDSDGVLHVFTSSGYSWTYYYDPDSVSITCEPHYDTNRYEFRITGLRPGTTQFNVYYYTDAEKTAFVKVPVTAEIDDNLRVTRIG